MTQIGFVGLGKMGGNMVHRIRRDSDHEVVAFDFDQKAVKQAVKNGAVGGAGAGGSKPDRSGRRAAR
jgi:6-phosphogluconate dehydrogenase